MSRNNEDNNGRAAVILAGALALGYSGCEDAERASVPAVALSDVCIRAIEQNRSTTKGKILKTPAALETLIDVDTARERDRIYEARGAYETPLDKRLVRNIYSDGRLTYHADSNGVLIYTTTSDGKMIYEPGGEYVKPIYAPSEIDKSDPLNSAAHENADDIITPSPVGIAPKYTYRPNADGTITKVTPDRVSSGPSVYKTNYGGFLNVGDAGKTPISPPIQVGHVYDITYRPAEHRSGVNTPLNFINNIITAVEKDPSARCE